jgi:hypothetical protein
MDRARRDRTLIAHRGMRPRALGLGSAHRLRSHRQGAGRSRTPKDNETGSICFVKPRKPAASRLVRRRPESAFGRNVRLCCRDRLRQLRERIATPAVRRMRRPKVLPLARGCALSFALRSGRAMSRRQLSTGVILEKSLSARTLAAVPRDKPPPRGKLRSWHWP